MPTAPVKLDRKRSYGTVYGDPGIGFMQDELPFRHDGTLHPTAQPKEPPVTQTPVVDTVPTAASFPTANQVADSAPVLRAIEQLSSQIQELKPETKAPDPARSEAMRKIWVERRAREAAAREPAPTEP